MIVLQRLLKIFILLLLLCLLPYNLSAQAKLIKEVKEEVPGRQHYFGSSVAMDSNFAVVIGVHSANPNSYGGGAAYVYELISGKWKFKSRLYPEKSSYQDRFGQGACDMSGNTIIVGDWKNQINTQGAAHLFTLGEDTNWTYIDRLLPKDTSGIESFGRRVAVRGNIALVSTYNEVFVFERNVTDKWEQTAVLYEKDYQSEGFGGKLEIFDEKLYVTAQWEDSKDFKNLGAVYEFSKIAGKWEMAQKIVPPNSYVEDKLEFGNALAIDDKTLLIAAQNKDMGEIPSAGAVFIYKKNAGKWEYENLLYNEHFKYNIYSFGKELLLTDDFLYVLEAQDENHNSTTHIYQKESDEFVLLDTVKHDQDLGENFVAANGNYLLIGEGDDDYCDDFRGGCGKAKFYKVSRKKKREIKNDISQARNFGFNSTEIKHIQQKFKGDKILFDYINEDMVFKMRNKETGLWGMFMGDDMKIPMEFDSLKFFGWNDPFTIVGKEGLLGIYTAPWNYNGRHSVPCKYEEFKIYSHEGQLWLAGLINKKWRWVNWANADENSQRTDYHQGLYIDKDWKPGK